MQTAANRTSVLTGVDLKIKSEKQKYCQVCRQGTWNEWAIYLRRRRWIDNMTGGTIMWFKLYWAWMERVLFFWRGQNHFRVFVNTCKRCEKRKRCINMKSAMERLLTKLLCSNVYAQLSPTTMRQIHWFGQPNLWCWSFAAWTANRVDGSHETGGFFWFIRQYRRVSLATKTVRMSSSFSYGDSIEEFLLDNRDYTGEDSRDVHSSGQWDSTGRTVWEIFYLLKSFGWNVVGPV